MSYFPHAYQKSFVATNATPLISAAGTASSALLAGQIALIDATSNLSVGLSTSLPLYSSTALAYLAQGSFHTKDKMGPFHGGYQESVKSKGINPKYISSFTVSEPMTPVQDIQQIPVSVGCNVTCNTTYRLRIDIKGSPALRFLTHNAYFTLDAFTGCCDTLSPVSNVDPNIVLLGWADRLALYPTVKDFVQAKVWNQVLVSGTAATATASANPTAATVTAASAASGTVTYSATNTFTAGQTVSITGLSTAAFNLTAVVIATASGSQFTVTNAATGTAVTGATATATVTISPFLVLSSITGVAGGQRVVFTPTTNTSATSSTIAGNTFTVGTATNTIFSVGQVLTGTGVATGTTIVSRVSGGGGTGSVFTVNICQTVASTTIASASPITAYVKATPTTTTVTLVAADTIQSPSTTDINTVVTTSITPKIFGVITTDTYTVLTGASAPDSVNSFLEIVGAYVDTTFGDASFSPRDHVEYQPVELYASVTALDPLGNQCLAACFDPPTATKTYEVQQSIQGRGFGETLVRELILSKRYQQEPWIQDPRLREVMDYGLANPAITNELSRSGKYFIYNLVHSVPRKANPSGMMDNDQYLIRIYSLVRLTALEQGLVKWLDTANNQDVKFTLLP